MKPMASFLRTYLLPLAIYLLCRLNFSSVPPCYTNFHRHHHHPVTVLGQGSLLFSILHSIEVVDLV